MKHSLFEELTGPHLVKNFPHFIETWSSLLVSKPHAICPYPESEQSSQCPISLLGDPFEYYSPTYAKVIKAYPFLRFPHKNPVCTYLLHIQATYVTHFFLPNLVTLVIFAVYISTLYLVFRFLWPCIVSKLWSERENQQDATVWCLLSTLSQHVSGIIMPIFRRPKRVLLHVLCCAGSAGCGW